MAAFVREVRGLPLWLLREYLVEEGGRAEGENAEGRDAEGNDAEGKTKVVGEGWTVRLEQMDDFVVGSLRVGQIRVELDGEPDALARMQAILERKLLRAGG